MYCMNQNVLYEPKKTNIMKCMAFCGKNKMEILQHVLRNAVSVHVA
jgi:hypothetical protein